MTPSIPVASEAEIEAAGAAIQKLSPHGWPITKTEGKNFAQAALSAASLVRASHVEPEAFVDEQIRHWTMMDTEGAPRISPERARKIALSAASLVRASHVEPEWNAAIEAAAKVAERVGIVEADPDPSSSYERGMHDTAKKAAAAIRSLARPQPPAADSQQAAEQGWQPIETAPKDGTAILACYFESGADALPVVSCFWSRLNDCWFAEISGQYVYPTHWRKLPAPPLHAAPHKSEGEER